MNEASQRSLESLQRWLQAVITHPEGVSAGTQSPAARAQIDASPGSLEQVVTRSRALSARERLEIYSRAYFSRLLECLRHEYSVLAAALGDELFDAFALGYLREYPSQSYTLARLGDRFPDYLAATRPAGDGEPDADWPEFLIDLARLERTVNEVFDAPGPERLELLDQRRMEAIDPAEWPQAIVECVPSLRLMELCYPVNEYFTAVRRKESPEIPGSAPSWLAVTRRNYQVRRYSLQRSQFELLRALQGGETVNQAIARAAASSLLPDDQFANALRDWFYFWTAEGFFVAVRTGEYSPRELDS